ncbi:GNAT family N-acetyltransferase [Ruegeria marina]|uniref:Acetyltransferase involved in cellulose biosynthesis, CelD/BcsL family n=1 Tax=Ruegeria marina TaxID=639004 RepID=A0A1G6T677_9RHOB|nr:GNAT family N-acetyltransferase [Ruegeria marina]SDD23967.1 Acetyltransferase involved in cellulose biosynthesis, CelD/BcsL family [Ruegeria marina]
MDGAADILTLAVQASGLRVASVERMEDLTALRDRWRALEGRDPEGTVFLSWDWLERAFSGNPGRWRVLAVFHGPRLVCVFPLKYRVHWSSSRQEFQSEIEAGGRLLWSEYTGFLCEPAYEDAAIAALAEVLRQRPWVRLSLRYEGSQARAAKFMAAFPGEEYSARRKDYFINKGETDNLICPRVHLPATYEDWLTTGPSKNTRQKIRRFTRRYLESGECTLSHASGDALKADMAALLRLWMRKWAPVKGVETARQVAANYLRILTTASQLGLLYMPVLKRNGQVLGALGHVVDPRMRRVHFIVAGRDESAEGHFIGLLLHAQAIGWAIRQGHEIYDFCHGNEPYKYSFGAQESRVAYFTIRRRALPAPGRSLDPISGKAALGRVLGFVEAEQTREAAAGCRQLLGMMDRPARE